MKRLLFGASRVSALAFFVSAGALIVGSLPQPTVAQSVGQLSSRVNQLQTDLNYVGQLIAELQQAVRQEQGARQAAVGIESRIGALETEMRNLVGSFETLTFEVKQIDQRNETALARMEFQIKALEERFAASGTDGSINAALPSEGELGFKPLGTTVTATTVPVPMATDSVEEFDPYSDGSIPNFEVALADRQDGPAQSYRVAQDYYRSALFQEAEEAFTTFLSSFPEDKLAANASYWLAESHYARGDFTKAAIQFASGFRKYGDSGKGPDHLYKLALSLEQLGRRDEACGSLSLLSSKYGLSRPEMARRAQAQSALLSCG